MATAKHVYSQEAADWVCLTCGLVTDHCRCDEEPVPDVVRDMVQWACDEVEAGEACGPLSE